MIRDTRGKRFGNVYPPPLCRSPKRFGGGFDRWVPARLPLPLQASGTREPLTEAPPPPKVAGSTRRERGGVPLNEACIRAMHMTVC